ncbi:MAG TPA: UDP-N-acetylmuramoyl-L-alanine--D-glutamate ligase, partial [Tahibacter sp.]|nr:UDP-N-acetylmuramoyl-L-alanine--D-glutamate ligase [Tahibacter sp.]
VALAREWTPSGGVVLLSPGAPSFDQFRDYADRGRAFTQLAGFDPQSISAIEGLGVA